MKLTKEDKEVFVDAVIADIPLVNYEQQMRDAAMKYCIDLLPPEVRVAYSKYPDYFDTKSIDTPRLEPKGDDRWRSFSIYVPSKNNIATEKYPELWERLQNLANLENAQVIKVKELRSKLKGIIGACSTLKRAKELLPEFEEYLPADRENTGTENLPVANVIADLNALGWPK